MHRRYVLCIRVSHFSEFISGFNGAMLSVVGDVPVDSDALVVTS